ncbi:MAG TPA: glycosyltransferase family 4 protein [Nitrososphaerales archaeon]|nr:glycosyltransferase family 4 protein [Nitrososphaerales archaeon]
MCLVNSFYPPWTGGAETYTSSLAKGLARNGHEVTVYCACNPLPPGESFEQGVRVRRMRAPIRLYGTPIAISPFNLLVEDYDIVHCNFPSPYLAALFSWFSKAKRIPSVLTWHNDLPRVTTAAGILVRAHDFLSPSYLEFYRRIIATTGVYAESSKTLRKYVKKVRVVPNGVDTTRFSPHLSGERIRETYGLQNKVVVLFVGALTQWHAYKGVDDLITAFKLSSSRQDSLRLLVVGSGPVLPFYENMVRNLSLADKVIFAKNVPDDLLPSYYAASDLVALPSKNRSEGFGLVLLEAMATAKPVIGSNVGGISGVIRQGETGLLVNPNEPESLAGAMLKLANDRDLRDYIGKNGRLFAEEHDWSATVAAVEKVYAEARDEHAAGK